MAYTGPRGSGGTPLLSDYLKANRQQGERMGNALADRVNQQAGQVKSAVDRGLADYTQKVGTQAWAAAPSYGEAKEGLGMAEARETHLTKDGKLDEFSDVANVNALNAQADRAQQTAALAGSQDGRGVLFREQMGPNGGYTIGSSMLDGAIAGYGAGKRLNQVSGRNRTSLSEYVKGAGTKAKSVYDSELASAQGAKKMYADYMTANPYKPPPAPVSYGPDYGRKGSPMKRLPKPGQKMREVD